MTQRFFSAILTSIIAVCGLLAAPGCASDTVDPGTTTPTFTSIQTSILTPSCAVSGCHGASGPQEGMNLSAGSAYSMLVGVASSQVPARMRVKAGAPDESYIINKLEGTNMKSGSSRMPQGGTLTAAQIKTIRDWITAGAKND